MPADVDRYYKEVKDSNPEYSESQAWATAWSIYCKHKNPGSDHCQKPPSEYLKQGMVQRLVARSLGAAASPLQSFAQEAKKDGEAGASWLQAFDRRVCKTLDDLAAKVQQDWAGSTLRDAVRQTKEEIHLFAQTGKASTFSYPFLEAQDVMDDPENYADGQDREDNPYTPILKMLAKEAQVAETFAGRIFDKYGLRTRAEMRKKVTGEELRALDRAFERFMDGIMEKPFKGVFEQFSKDLGA